MNDFLNDNPFYIHTDFHTESSIQLGWEHEANQMEAWISYGFVQRQPADLWPQGAERKLIL